MQYRNCAYQITERSCRSAEQGQYFLAWAESALARLVFAVDAVIRLTLALWHTMRCAGCAVQALYTWQRPAELGEQWNHLAEQTHQLFFSTLGILTPYFAHQWHEVSLVKRVNTACQLLVPDRLNIWPFSWNVRGRLLTRRHSL